MDKCKYLSSVVRETNTDGDLKGKCESIVLMQICYYKNSFTVLITISDKTIRMRNYYYHFFTYIIIHVTGKKNNTMSKIGIIQTLYVVQENIKKIKS